MMTTAQSKAIRVVALCALLLLALGASVTPAVADPPPVRLGVPFYTQFHPLWSEIAVGKHLDVPMRRGGSLLTCIAMYASYENLSPRFVAPGEENLAPTPDYIDAYLVFVNGYQASDPKTVVINYSALRRGFVTGADRVPAGISFAPTPRGEILSRVDEALAFGHPSIVYTEPLPGRFHPLVVTGWDAESRSYLVLDPAWYALAHAPVAMAGIYGKEWRKEIVGGLTASISNDNEVVPPTDPVPLGLSKNRNQPGLLRDAAAPSVALGPLADPTRVALDPLISVATNAGVEITAVDPAGRRVGFDPSTGTTIAEVPRASYLPDPRFADPAGRLVPPAPGRVLTIPRAAAGRYRFEMVATQSGPYALDVRGGDRVVEESLEGTLSAGEVLKFQVEYSDSGPSRFTVGDNFAPEANAGGARRTRIGAPVAFDAGASFDIDGTITAYHWDFGDGATATGLTPSHAYAAAGIYTATLTVTDDHQVVGTDTAKVAVYAETTTAGVTEIASVDSTGALATGSDSGDAFFYPALSGDGRFVAFSSRGGELDGHHGGVFLRDRQRGTTTAVSPSTCYGTAFPALSATGRFAAFECEIVGDGIGMRTIRVLDRLTGVSERVDVASTGEGGVCDGPGCGSIRPAISEDGRYVAFLSTAANLVPGDSNGVQDAFIHDRATGTTERVNVANDGTEDEGGAGGGTPEYQRVDVSADGRFVAFASGSDSLVPGTPFPAARVYVRDRVQHVTELVSTSTSGSVSGTTGGEYPSMSADGRFVAFSSPSSDLVPGDTNGAIDVFVRDRQTGTTTRVDVTGAGGEAVCTSLISGQPHICTRNPVISRDGRVVVFRSQADNLILDDDNHREDVFARDLEHGTTTLVSRATDDTLGNGQSGEAHFTNDATQIGVSRDGRFVAFTSDATNLIAVDDNGLEDVFVRDRLPNSPIADPSGPYVGLVDSAGEPASVTFDASRSVDPLGQPLTAQWDFGDGSALATASSATPVVHAYAASGTYEVRLVVSAGARHSAPATTTAFIQAVRTPTLRLQAPCGNPGESVGATATDFPLVSAVGGWNLGTGPVPTDAIAAGGTTRVRVSGPLPAAVEQVVPIDATAAATLTFAKSFSIDVDAGWGPGTYTVSLPDDGGRAATFTVPCPALANEPPHAHVGGPYTGTVGVPVQFDGGASTDAEGAPLKFTWYFDDGTTATGPAPSHAFATSGVHYAVLVVDDGTLESPSTVGTDSFAIVTITGGSGETSLGSFTVYQTKTAAGAVALPKLGPVALADAIGSANYLVTKGAGLAVPADVDAGGVADADTHLAAYAVKRAKGSAKFAPAIDVPVETACGATVVTLAKPTQLLIPAHASASGSATPPNDDESTVDRFLCYAAKRQKRRHDGTPVASLPKGAQVDVADAFQTRRYDLKKLVLVCNPVALSGTPSVLAGPRKGTTIPLTAESIRTPDARIACFSAKLAKREIPQTTCGLGDPKDKGTKIVPAQPKHVPQRGVAIADALETSAVDTKKERLVCLPAS